MPEYWWVNHKQTFRQEIDGQYLWSPKRKSNGARNEFYNNMRKLDEFRSDGCNVEQS